ncbi:MAG TPA: cytochrome bc complex cytochrome b subunit [candidate division Zixibacteria bacterium]|nr:cytochrome bc complex cytochrome b subunit [candidate division Zixibacteria bacterium]
MERARERLWRWLDERIGLEDLARLAKKKEVPVHRHTVWYYFGGMTLFLFAIQVVTGILLLLYYRPSANEAFESIQFLMTEVEFGWLVRSIHAWSANLMVFSMFIHLFSTLLLRAYRAPREITWLSGSGLLGLTLAFGFTGYLLPWNELAFFATRVGTEIPGVLPLVGPFLRRLLRGGDDVTGATLTRFYGIHVAVLPALTTVVLAVHLFMVQKHGMSSPPGVEREGPKRSMPFFPNFLLRDLVGWLSALAVLAALAAYFPAELGKKADPFQPAPAGIKPEWYFMAMFQTLKLLPGHILGIEGELLGVLGFGVVGLLLIALPFLDTRAGERPSRFPAVFGITLLVYMVVLTFLGYTMSPTK